MFKNNLGMRVNFLIKVVINLMNVVLVVSGVNRVFSSAT